MDESSRSQYKKIFLFSYGCTVLYTIRCDVTLHFESPEGSIKCAHTTHRLLVVRPVHCAIVALEWGYEHLA